jgi:transposase
VPSKKSTGTKNKRPGSGRTRRTKPSPSRAASPQFAVVHPDAAGIDIGGQSHWVAVPPERSGETVREFSAFTHSLHEMADWLKSHNVRTVAMEATGVLWIPVFEVLETAGFEVYLVNAAHVKNVSGRKSDLQDCQWLQKLHACGLLQRSFRPDDKTAVLRSYVRQRGELVRAQAASTLRMQKALVQMNLQLHLVVSDITGVTGLSILKRILAGERDPLVLAALRDARCKRSEAEIAEALRGTWREEHLFALRQSLATYEHLERQIGEVDQQIHQALAAMDNDPRVDPNTVLEPPRPQIRVAQKALGFDARTMLYQKAGADLTRILGISLLTALTIVSEIGTDMSRWPTVKHFASWLGLAPNKRISGGKELSSHTRKTKNRAAQALRMAASTLYRSDTVLAAFYRRKLPKGKPVAITATAHRMARWIYTILKNGTEYAEERLAHEVARNRDRQLAALKRNAAHLGLALVPKDVAETSRGQQEDSSSHA